jgi:tRNA(Ile2) C34 agmatinyltransferase TiaS
LKSGGGLIAALAAIVLPRDQWSLIAEGYVSLCLKPFGLAGG